MPVCGGGQAAMATLAAMSDMLYEAINNGDVDAVMDLLKKGLVIEIIVVHFPWLSKFEMTLGSMLIKKSLCNFLLPLFIFLCNLHFFCTFMKQVPTSMWFHHAAGLHSAEQLS